MAACDARAGVGLSADTDPRRNAHMSVTETVFGTVGGLGLFLFGMRYLSDGLKRAAGASLRRLLEKVTKWSLMALLVGAGVTCLIQSSSATTVMVVGLVNAGLLSLKQAIGVVLGANIGTTFTAWLVAGMSVFKISLYALPAVGLGFALQVFARRPRTKHIGQVLLGFGILFIGIHYMKDAFSPLRESAQVRNLLIAIGDRPILAVLAGASITMLVQSSSASIAMIQALAFAGAFGTDWETVLRVTIPFILGDNIGTTITAQLASLQTNLAGRRTAMAHTLFNVLGVIVALPVVYAGWYVVLVKWISPLALSRGTIMVHIAISHSMFNVLAALGMLPFIGGLEKLVAKVVPARRRRPEQMPVTLERHLLETPPLAMDQARREIVRMSRTAKEALELAVTAITRDDESALARVVRKEDAVDNFQTEITRYLVELSQRTLEPEMANELPVLLHTVNDIERVADHAVNIAEVAERKIGGRQTFSRPAQDEIARMELEVAHMFDKVLLAVERSDRQAARGALAHEDEINRMHLDCRCNHIGRLSNGTCDALAGLSFVDLISSLEKIGDHLANVAQGVLGGLQWGAQARASAGQDDAPPQPPDAEKGLEPNVPAAAPS
jgi:phosphate:Na+ symporter